VSTSLTWLIDVCSVPFVTGAVSFDPPEFALSVGSLEDSPLRSAGYVESDLGVCGSAVRRARFAANWRISQLQHMYGTDERADSDRPDARPCLSITVDSQAEAQFCNLITRSIFSPPRRKLFSDRDLLATFYRLLHRDSCYSTGYYYRTTSRNAYYAWCTACN